MPVALVTGANGFIGTHLVRTLVTRGIEVRGLVRPTSNLTSLQGISIPLYLGDLRYKRTLEVPTSAVDYVFHLGAELMVTSRLAFEEANVDGTRNLLEAATRYSPELKRFLFVSSQAAAGPGTDVTSYDESKTPDPISWYGSSKQQAEEIVRSYGDQIPFTIVRPSSVYGEHERDISQIFPLVSCRLHPRVGIRSKHLVVVYVRDLVEGIIEAALNERTVGETYFLNHKESLTSKSFMKGIARAMGKPGGLTLPPTPTFLVKLAAPLVELLYHFTRGRPSITRDKAREIAQRFWVADPSKAKRDFGWEAKHDIAAGMKPTVRWWSEQQHEIVRLAGDSPTGAWIKTVLVAITLGALIAAISKIGDFYTFTPTWGVILVVLGFFGLALGTLTHFFRRFCFLVQFILGWIVAFAAEVLNHLGALPGLSWTFATSWPFGIDDGWWRSVVLGVTGGIFILGVNTIMKSMYRRRLRLG